MPGLLPTNAAYCRPLTHVFKSYKYHRKPPSSKDTSSIKRMFKKKAGSVSYHVLLLVLWLCEDCRPLSTVQSTGFKAFISAIAPSFKIPARDTIKRVIFRLKLLLVKAVSGGVGRSWAGVGCDDAAIFERCQQGFLNNDQFCQSRIHYYLFILCFLLLLLVSLSVSLSLLHDNEGMDSASDPHDSTDHDRPPHPTPTLSLIVTTAHVCLEKSKCRATCDL